MPGHVWPAEPMAEHPRAQAAKSVYVLLSVIDARAIGHLQHGWQLNGEATAAMHLFMIIDRSLTWEGRCIVAFIWLGTCIEIVGSSPIVCTT